MTASTGLGRPTRAAAISTWRRTSSRSTRRRAYIRSWRRNILSARSTTQSRGMWIPPASPTPMPRRHASRGAEVYRFTRVTELTQRSNGSWDVVTEKGTIRAEHVVNAGGLWAREIGRMVGLELPVLAMEHQYLITGEIPEVKASAKEM